MNRVCSRAGLPRGRQPCRRYRGFGSDQRGIDADRRSITAIVPTTEIARAKLLYGETLGFTRCEYLDVRAAVNQLRDRGVRFEDWTSRS